MTTGCGQGSVLGDLMADVDNLLPPPATLTQRQLYGIVNAIRRRATNKRFLCFSGSERLLQPELAGARLQAVA